MKYFEAEPREVPGSVGRLVQCCVLVAAMLTALTACQNSAPPRTAASNPAVASHGYTVRWLRPLQDRGENDGVEVIDHGWRGGVQLVVTSKSGTGEAEVQPSGTFWPRQVQVRFQYAPGKPFDKLERLYLQVIDSAPLAGNQNPDLDPVDGFVIWQREGATRVDLPAGWLHTWQTLHIVWADRLDSSLVLPGSPQTPPVTHKSVN